MIYNEKRADLFSLPKDYALCYCVSSDFVLDKEIAKRFIKREITRKLRKTFKQRWDNKGYCCLTKVTNHICEFNLITQERSDSKPTLNTIREALEDVKSYIGYFEIKQIAMSKIGCDPDKLKWADVKEIVKDVFKDTNVEILVCYT